MENPVENPGGKNVDCSYPQIITKSTLFIQRVYPQLFFSVYKGLGDLLGFPRPYYYY